MAPRTKAAFLDTNVVLRFLLDDDRDQSPRARDLFKRLEDGKEQAFLEDVILAETVWVLQKFVRVPRDEIARTLSDLVSIKGVRTRGKRITLDSLARFGATNIDIADCLLAARARSRRGKVWSFDEDFKKLDVAWSPP